MLSLNQKRRKPPVNPILRHILIYMNINKGVSSTANILDIFFATILKNFQHLINVTKHYILKCLNTPGCTSLIVTEVPLKVNKIMSYS